MQIDNIYKDNKKNNKKERKSIKIKFNEIRKEQ